MVKSSIRTTLTCGVLVLALTFGTGAAANPVIASTHSASAAATTQMTKQAAPVMALASADVWSQVMTLAIRPARDMTACWQQVGRVIGGFYGALLSTIAGPWAAIPIWLAYLGALGQEKRNKMGNLAC